MNTHSQLFKRNFVSKGLLSASSVLLLSAIATPSQAATFTVEFSGPLNSLITTMSSTSSIGQPPFTQQTDFGEGERRVEGQYTFDDTTSELLSASYSYVTADIGAVTPNEFTPSPFSSFQEGIDAVGFPDFTVTNSSADETFATFTRTDYSSSASSSTTFSVDSQDFSAASTISGPGQFDTTTYLGSIDTFGLISDMTPTEPVEPMEPMEPSMPTTPMVPSPGGDPASVPEPATAAGFLVLIGLGASLRRREQTA